MAGIDPLLVGRGAGSRILIGLVYLSLRLARNSQPRHGKQPHTNI